VEISERAPDIADFVVNVQNIMLGGLVNRSAHPVL